MIFNPIYGWGWFKGSSGTVSVPPPINVKVASRTEQIVDGVVNEPHEYAGWKIHCESRDSGAKYMVVLDSPDGDERVIGFANRDT